MEKVQESEESEKDFREDNNIGSFINDYAPLLE